MKLNETQSYLIKPKYMLLQYIFSIKHKKHILKLTQDPKPFKIIHVSKNCRNRTVNRITILFVQCIIALHISETLNTKLLEILINTFFNDHYSH